MRALVVALALALTLGGPHLARAKGGEQRGAPFSLTADGEVASQLGPLWIRAGTVTLYNPGQQIHDRAPVTRQSALRKGVLARAHTLLGLRLPAGTEIELPIQRGERVAGSGRLIVHTGSSTWGGVTLVGPITIDVAAGVARIDGTLAAPTMIEGLPLAPTAVQISGTPADLQANRAARFGAGTIAQDGIVQLGKAQVDLAVGDRPTTKLTYGTQWWPDDTRLVVELATPRVIAGRYRARNSATWSLVTGHLVQFVPAEDQRIETARGAVLVQAGSSTVPSNFGSGTVTFYDSGELHSASPATEIVRDGLRLGPGRVDASSSLPTMTFWPSGAPRCALSRDPQLFAAATAEQRQRGVVKLDFDPTGAPRLATFEDGQTVFAIHRAGAAYRYRALAADHPIGVDHRCDGIPDAQTERWLRAVASTRESPPMCDGYFPNDHSLRAPSALSPTAIDRFLAARPTSGRVAFDGFAVAHDDHAIVLSATRYAGVKQPISPQYDLWIEMPQPRSVPLHSKYRVEVEVCGKRLLMRHYSWLA